MSLQNRLLVGSLVVLLAWTPGVTASPSVWVDYYTPQFYVDKLVFFDDEGVITDVIELGGPSSGRVFFNRIADSRYHSLVITSDFFVFHETTKGPFIAGNRTDTVFAPWAPKDGEDELIKNYMVKTEQDAKVFNENRKQTPVI